MIFLSSCVFISELTLVERWRDFLVVCFAVVGRMNLRVLFDISRRCVWLGKGVGGAGWGL
jgi:hypothetical protein